MEIEAPKWLAGMGNMTGSSLWGAVLVLCVFGPFWLFGEHAANPTFWAQVGCSALVTSVYCGLSIWALRDRARYYAEWRAREEAYKAANTQAAERIERIRVWVEQVLIKDGHATAVPAVAEPFASALAPLVPPPVKGP
jgi:hypothetical protein